MGRRGRCKNCIHFMKKYNLSGICNECPEAGLVGADSICPNFSPKYLQYAKQRIEKREIMKGVAYNPKDVHSVTCPSAQAVAIIELSKKTRYPVGYLVGQAIAKYIKGKKVQDNE